MGIGPSTKETSLHHFRDPLLDVVSSDEDLDLMGIIIVQPYLRNLRHCFPIHRTTG